CDDGNTVSGDGCSADCQTVEYGPICAAAAALAPDSATPGDTRHGRDGFMATCQAGIARADVYRFVPPGRGRLRLTLASATEQVLPTRTACDAAGGEPGCADTRAPEPVNQLVTQVTDAGAELTVLVSAVNVIEEGPYTLDLEWTPESCGDGIVAGAEAC